ncbi:MAG: glucose 1-dehydrogenase [Gammaproteobacteria bacterium]|nr:glucose 1-dehydrogenase [Gammaproteobacteria bacterium]
MTAGKTIKSLFELNGKVALITGASKGIGESIGRGMAEFGAKVILSSRKQNAVDALAEEFRKDGLDAIGIAANVGSSEDIQQLIERVCETRGGLDILVNNAGANPVFGPIQNTGDTAFDKVVNVNLKGPFELCKAAYPIFKQRGGGAIINISSIGGITPEQFIGVYSISKAAINSMTKAMAQDWGTDNIRVNSICPGLIRTKFSEALWKNEDILERFVSRIPLGRAGNPEDIAGLAVYLASDAAAYCTGGIYMADGGYSST